VKLQEFEEKKIEKKRAIRIIIEREKNQYFIDILKR